MNVNFCIVDCGNADILVIMDESGSVGSEHFNTMKTFIRDVIRGLNSVFFRFSVITYSTSARKIFGFLDFNHLNVIMTSIERIQYSAGGFTKTDRALEYARVSIFNTTRADAADIVILFTDGKSDNSEKTKEEAALLRNEGVRIFSIGVGSGPKIEELQSIASSPSDEHVFQVSSFSALSHILNAVQTRTCQGILEKHSLSYNKISKIVVFITFFLNIFLPLQRLLMVDSVNGLCGHSVVERADMVSSQDAGHVQIQCLLEMAETALELTQKIRYAL